MQQQTKKSSLYLIPTPISDKINSHLYLDSRKIIEEIDLYYVENKKSAREFLKNFELRVPIQKIEMIQISKDIQENDLIELKTKINSGHNVGLLSEAGCPCIADPGNRVVSYAHRNKINVKPLIGASSIILALMASGLNGQNFEFYGYFPIKEVEQGKIINKIHTEKNKTHIFIETPYRNKKLLDFLIQKLTAKALLSISSDLTGTGESILTMSIDEWRKQLEFIPQKIPTIFCIGA